MNFRLTRKSTIKLFEQGYYEKRCMDTGIIAIIQTIKQRISFKITKIEQNGKMYHIPPHFIPTIKQGNTMEQIKNSMYIMRDTMGTTWYTDPAWF